MKYTKSFLIKKCILFSIGMYATIGLVIFGFRYINRLPLPFFASLSLAFFIAAFLRLLYEQLFVYDLSFGQLDIKKNTVFALVSALITASLYFLVRGALGFWGVPVAIAGSKFLASKIKSTMWEKSPELRFDIGVYAKGLYAFYGILGGLAYILVHYNFYSFSTSFTISCFIALLFGFYYESVLLNINVRTFGKFMLLIVAAAVSIASAALVLLLITRYNFSGQAATIMVAIGLKTLQTLLISKMDITR